MAAYRIGGNLGHWALIWGGRLLLDGGLTFQRAQYTDGLRLSQCSKNNGTSAAFWAGRITDDWSTMRPHLEGSHA